jgi:hypothetical protein
MSTVVDDHQAILTVMFPYELIGHRMEACLWITVFLVVAGGLNSGKLGLVVERVLKHFLYLSILMTWPLAMINIKILLMANTNLVSRFLLKFIIFPHDHHHRNVEISHWYAELLQHGFVPTQLLL